MMILGIRVTQKFFKFENIPKNEENKTKERARERVHKKIIGVEKNIEFN